MSGRPKRERVGAKRERALDEYCIDDVGFDDLDAGSAAGSKKAQKQDRNRQSAARSRDKQSQILAAHQVLQAWARTQDLSLPIEPVKVCRERPDFSVITDKVERRKARNADSAAKSRDERKGYLDFCNQCKDKLITQIGPQSLESIWAQISQHVSTLEIVKGSPVRTPLTSAQVSEVLSNIKLVGAPVSAPVALAAPVFALAAPVVAAAVRGASPGLIKSPFNSDFDDFSAFDPPVLDARDRVDLDALSLCLGDGRYSCSPSPTLSNLADDEFTAQVMRDALLFLGAGQSPTKDGSPGLLDGLMTPKRRPE